MSVDTLLNNGRLKSFSYDDGITVLEEKPAPQYRVYFEAVDKRLLKQKKASKVVIIDRTVPQDMLTEVWAEVMSAVKALEVAEARKVAKFHAKTERVAN